MSFNPGCPSQELPKVKAKQRKGVQKEEDPKTRQSTTEQKPGGPQDDGDDCPLRQLCFRSYRVTHLSQS